MTVLHDLIVLSHLLSNYDYYFCFFLFNVNYHNDKKYIHRHINTQCATQINLAAKQLQRSLCELLSLTDFLNLLSAKSGWLATVNTPFLAYS